MDALVENLHSCLEQLYSSAQQVSLQTWILISLTAFLTLVTLLYAVIYIFAPVPRAPLRIEEEYVTCLPNGERTTPKKLPCWHYAYLNKKELSQRKEPGVDKLDVEPAEIFMSLVVPAFNEEKRIEPMLAEAIHFLRDEYGSVHDNESTVPKKPQQSSQTPANGAFRRDNDETLLWSRGWEILVVSDGSTDKTGDIVLDFAKRYPEGSIRLISLARNRGKGGAVTHGMRHVRGEYAIFADADGASKFEDLRKLVKACQSIKDEHGRAVAVGSRAHMVSSEAVVKRSKLRNFLMHCFHLLLWFLTPKRTSQIKDTQCGFKLFSRQSLPYIIPHMHSEGWIFDVEMLMLAESAKIPMAEVPIGWKEVGGSKLNVVWDSLGMAYGLAMLRVAWGIGVYRV